ncbi:DUF5105 domain-containing protein [Listeria costaricensis]|uniref:DUF5105 domain-containing protein n=1 Tax=Listeria costaricensis TaxID=2026604 RepID=UPI000C084FBF|nr:DUF5105 domain-containing protein [Listeria costaricensis]
MKKFIGSLAIISLIMLAGCGGTADQKKEKNANKVATTASTDLAKVEVQEGNYVILPDVSEDELSTIALKMKVTNTSKGKLSLTARNFVLYEAGDDEKIKAEDVYADELNVLDYDTLSKDKSTTGSIFFNIDPKKEYKLVFEAMNDNGDNEDVELTLDMAKYEDSKEGFKESENAANAFLDVQFLNNENENYAKLVANDKEETKAEFLKTYKKENEDRLFSELTLSDQDYQNCFNSFTSTQGKRAKLNTELSAYYGDQAILEITLDEALSNSSIYDLSYQYERNYIDSSDNYDYDAAEKYAYSKYTEILEKSPLKSESDEIHLYLKKKDGKWYVDLDEMHNEQTISAFLGNIY